MTKSDSDKIEFIAQQLALVLNKVDKIDSLENETKRTNDRLDSLEKEMRDGFDSLRGSIIKTESDISDIKAILIEGHSPKLDKHEEKLDDHEKRIGSLESPN